jgi:TRAP-type mannitol/chloroaromatic compound transport system permease large subunit
VKLRREQLFGFGIMALIVIPVLILTPWTNLFDAHLDKSDLGVLGLLMLALIVVAIMLGFPTAFTLMGMGVFFAWLAYRSVNPDLAIQQVLDLFVQRTYGVMSNDVLIAIPLFLFMGYLVERAQLIDRLFHSLHLATARVPGSLAVATIVTCAIFATATGIVGAVVTLMGLLAFPAMLKAGYNVKVSAGAVTAGGCLGILIPPSVLLIVYGATAGVSVVQLYAGAFLPGFMLAALYIGYVILLAKWKPNLMPPLSEADQRVPLPPALQKLADAGGGVLSTLSRALAGRGVPGLPRRTILAQILVTFLPALAIVAIIGVSYRVATAPEKQTSGGGLVEAGGAVAADTGDEQPAGIIGAEEEQPQEAAQPAGADQKPQEATAPGAQPVEAAKPAETAKPAATSPPAQPAQAAKPAAAAERVPAGPIYYGVLAVGVLALLLIYWMWTWERLQVFKLLLTSFFPLALLIIAVLGSIVVGLATPAEAAAVGAFGGFILAAIYRFIAHWRARAESGASAGAVLGRTIREFGGIIKESSFLTAKTSAMVCWLFVGSGIFSAAFALLGGQEIIEQWVLSLNMTPLQFMILAQAIIFILGWPLEWTEIIIIFMPIFIPLLPHFQIDPLFFGLLVALNLQTAFLSPPVAMAAFYLKGVSPPHVTLNAIFAGMMPFMGIQIIALVLLYTFPQIGLWLPSVFYAK